MATPSETENISYEQAFQRLESILEQMSTHDIELERSLELFEEADALIRLCQDKLNSAERRIEMVIKGRNGAPSIDKDGQLARAPLEEPEQERYKKPL